MVTTVRKGYTDEKFSFVATLATGGQGKVSAMRQKQGNKSLVAVKKVHCITASEENEVQVVEKYLDSSRYNIPKILDFYREPQGPITIVTPLYNGGALQDILDEYVIRGARVPEAFVWHVLSSLIDVVAHAHRHRVVHRDIKPENVFVQWKPGQDRRANYPALILGDWGLAMNIDSPDYIAQQKVGTLAWQPPELPAGTFASDVWGVGAVAHALCIHKPPIADPPPQYSQVPNFMDRWWSDGKTRAVTNIQKYGYSAVLWDMLRSMLRFEVYDRRTSDYLSCQLPGLADTYFRERFKPLEDYARKDRLDNLVGPCHSSPKDITMLQ